MNEDEILKTVAPRLKDAVNWSNSKLQHKSAEALKYYNRDLLPGDDKRRGLSKFVSPVVQQRVDWMTAQIIDIFSAPENVCEFLPFGPEDEAIAKQQTAVVNFLLKTKNKLNAYLHPWVQQGLLTGLSVVTVEFETETEESLPQTVKGLLDEQLVPFHQQEEAGQIIIEAAGTPYQSPAGMVRDLKIRTIRKTPVFSVLSVASDDFVVSKDAKIDATNGSIAAKVQGHRKYLSKSALLEMGFDAEKVKAVPLASDKTDPIAIERTKLIDSEQGISGDDVCVYTIYTRLKLDKKTRPYRLILAGSLDSPVLLSYDETSKYPPYAVFVPYPMADTLFSLGIPDRSGDEHTTITKAYRGMLDSLHMAINPVKVVNPDVTNIDDLLNIHPGSVIRSTDPQGGIYYNTPPFVGQAALPIVDNLSQSLDVSIGVGPSMMALDAADLQRTTTAATNQRSNYQQLLVSMMARHFADCGFSYLTRIVVDLLLQKPEEAQQLISRLTNGFVPTLDQFTPEFDVTTSVAFGVLTRDQAMTSLNSILAQQQQLMGSGSPIVTPQNLYATLSKLTEVAGHKNPGAFFTDPSTVQMPEPPPPPPSEAEITAQSYKLQAELKAQADERQRQFEMAKLQAELDFKRDQMAQELEIERAKIEAEYRAKVDIAWIKTQQDSPRIPVPMPTDQPQPQQQPLMQAPAPAPIDPAMIANAMGMQP